MVHHKNNPQSLFGDWRLALLFPIVIARKPLNNPVWNNNALDWLVWVADFFNETFRRFIAELENVDVDRCQRRT